MDDQYTFENKTYRDTYRHTTSHILAQAMKRLYPEAKLAIGPAIEDGFYYDFDSHQPFTPEVLEKLEAEMRKIVQGKAAPSNALSSRAPKRSKFMEETRRALQGRAHQRPAGGRRHLLLPSGRIHRPLRRPAPGLHRPRQG